MAAAMVSNIGLRESFAIGILMNTRGYATYFDGILQAYIDTFPYT